MIRATAEIPQRLNTRERIVCFEFNFMTPYSNTDELFERNPAASELRI